MSKTGCAQMRPQKWREPPWEVEGTGGTGATGSNLQAPLFKNCRQDLALGHLFCLNTGAS